MISFLSLPLFIYLPLAIHSYASVRNQVAKHDVHLEHQTPALLSSNPKSNLRRSVAATKARKRRHKHNRSHSGFDSTATIQDVDVDPPPNLNLRVPKLSDSSQAWRAYIRGVNAEHRLMLAWFRRIDAEEKEHRREMRRLEHDVNRLSRRMKGILPRLQACSACLRLIR